VFLTKKFKEKNHVTLFKCFLNALIMNIKIHNILDIIEISKYVEFNKYTHVKKIMKIFI